MMPPLCRRYLAWRRWWDRADDAFALWVRLELSWSTAWKIAGRLPRC